MSDNKKRLFQICDRDESLCDAGSKGFKDMAQIAEELGFERLEIKLESVEHSVSGFIRRHLGFVRDYIRAYKRITPGSVLLMQHPMYIPMPVRYLVFNRLKKKNVKFISHVIDVEELRGLMTNRFVKHEFEYMLKHSEVIIAHNQRMLEWFVSRGVSRERLVDVEIFDNIWSGEISKPKFEKSITVAGSLNLTKSGYLKYLGGVTDYPVHLYGLLVEKDDIRQYFTRAEYHGVFPPEELPKNLTGGFGLVWDGNAAEGGTGPFGDYLKYNDPHKLGLYLSAGLPVIVWKEAAAALFVEKYKVGLCIDNLNEIRDILDNISEEEWNVYSGNAIAISEKIRKGEHFRTAVVKAMDILDKA